MELLRLILLLILTQTIFGKDWDSLRQQAWSTLEKGSRSGDTETELLALFGAHLSQDETALSLFLRALRSPKPEIQLASIRYLANMRHDRADEAVLEGLISQDLLIRLETLYWMTERRMEGVTDQVEALIAKLPPVFHPLFPPLFALSGDPSSLERLRLLLSDRNEQVRAATLLSIEKTHREEFLPQIRRLAKQVNPLVQEAALSAIGHFEDHVSKSIVYRLTKSPHLGVRITALKTLTILDKERAFPLVVEESKQGNLFAICLLGEYEEGEKYLETILQTDHLEPKLNAALTLLQKGKKEGLRPLQEILLSKGVPIPFRTTLKSTFCWKLLPFVQAELPQNQQEIKWGREETLRRVFILPPPITLPFSREICQVGDHVFTASVIDHLETLGNQEAIELLQELANKLGDPFTRAAASLSLFRLGKTEVRPNLISFLKRHRDADLIQLEPFPEEIRSPFEAAYQLTPAETSSLYLKTIEALLTEGKEEVIELLQEAIEKGPTKNKYPLAGVLIRATL